jgi:hypothetical protein
MAVRLPASMKKRIRSEAKSRLLAPADIVREALVNHFAKSERKERVLV